MRKDSTAATAFYLLNVLLLPVTLIGYLIWIVGGLARANESKVSMTTSQPCCFSNFFTTSGLLSSAQV